jgi:hypothetical protein
MVRMLKMAKHKMWTLIVVVQLAVPTMAQSPTTTFGTGPATCGSAGDYTSTGAGPHALCAVPIVGGALDGSTAHFEYYNGAASVQFPRLDTTVPDLSFCDQFLPDYPEIFDQCVALLSQPQIVIDVSDDGPATLTRTAGEAAACDATVRYRLDLAGSPVFDDQGDLRYTVSGTQFLTLQLRRRIRVPRRLECVFVNLGSGTFVLTYL